MLRSRNLSLCLKNNARNLQTNDKGVRNIARNYKVSQTLRLGGLKESELEVWGICRGLGSRGCSRGGSGSGGLELGGSRGVGVGGWGR